MVDPAQIQELGLSEREARIYLASLEIGHATVDKLAKHANVNRSTAYLRISALMEMGLMTTFTEGKKTYFVAEVPDNLEKLFKRRKDELKIQETKLASLLPELRMLFAAAEDRPTIRFFEGLEALISVREEVLHMKKKELRTMYSYANLSKYFTLEELIEYTDRRIAKKIHTKALLTYDGKVPFTLPPRSEVRHLPKDQFPIEADLYIYDNTVVIASLQDKIVGAVIESPSVVKTMTSLFDLAWIAGKKYTVKK